MRALEPHPGRNAGSADDQILDKKLQSAERRVDAAREAQAPLRPTLCHDKRAANVEIRSEDLISRFFARFVPQPVVEAFNQRLGCHAGAPTAPPMRSGRTEMARPSGPVSTRVPQIVAAPRAGSNRPVPMPVTNRFSGSPLSMPITEL